MRLPLPYSASVLCFPRRPSSASSAVPGFGVDYRDDNDTALSGRIENDRNLEAAVVDVAARDPVLVLPGPNIALDMSQAAPPQDRAHVCQGDLMLLHPLICMRSNLNAEVLKKTKEIR